MKESRNKDRKQKAKTDVYGKLLENNLYHHESCDVLEDLLKHFRHLIEMDGETTGQEKKFPMGKHFKCHLGSFELPDEIYLVEMGEDYVVFHCENRITCRFEVKDYCIVSIVRRRNE